MVTTGRSAQAPSGARRIRTVDLMGVMRAIRISIAVCRI
jgi:hypothetical protein